MSFGYSIGDLISVTQLALKSYNAYKSARDDIGSLSNELNSLRLCVDDVRDIPKDRLSDSQLKKREQLLKGCYAVVEELNSLLKKYKSLDKAAIKGPKYKKNKKKRDIVLEKIKWIKEDPTALRNRLVSNIGLLNSFHMDYQRTKMEEMMAIQQLQFQSLQTTVRQHLHRPLNLYRQDSAASFGSVASFGTQNAVNARSPWKDLCRGLHDRGVRIRPESLTDNLVAQVAAILQVGGAYSSCGSTVSIENQPTITLSSPLLEPDNPPSAPSPLPRIFRTATIQMNELAISADEAAPHCPAHTSAPTIIRTATIQLDEFSVSNGDTESGTSAPLETLPETHALIRTTSFQINEFSVSEPIPIPQTGPNADSPKLARTSSFKIAITQRSVELQDYTVIRESSPGDHHSLTSGVMTILTSDAEAHAPGRLEFAKTPADRSRESGLTPIVEIFEDDHPEPMVAEAPKMCSADAGQRLDLDTNCIEKGQAVTALSLHNMDTEPLSVPSLCVPTMQELKCQTRGNTLDLDTPGQQQVVVSVDVDVPDASCNVDEPPPRGPTPTRDVDTAILEANEQKLVANLTKAHSTQSEPTATDAAKLVSSVSREREDMSPSGRIDITPFTYDPTLGKELYEAVKNNSIRTVEFLLKAGANANAAAPDFGNVLNLAVSSNYLQVAKLLLKHRAGVRSTIQNHKRKNNTQFTALHCAVSGGYYEMVELLLNKLEQLSDINLAEATTRALQFTLFRGIPQQRQVMQLLLGKHADVNARDSRGSTLLDRAISFGSSEAIKVLMEGGANISTQNRTALRRILVDTDGLQRFMVDMEEVTELLDEHGADHFLNDSYGESEAATVSGLGKEPKHNIRLPTESNTGTVRSESPSSSPSAESTDNSLPKTSPTASKGTQNDPIFKFAAQCFIDILTQMQSQGQKRTTIDENLLETKFIIDTEGGNSPIELECTIIAPVGECTPAENTSTNDSTATAGPLPYFTGATVSSSYSTAEATPAPPPLTTDATCKPETPVVRPDKTENKFLAAFVLKSPISAADEKKEDSTPEAKQPTSDPLDVKINDLAARRETQFPIYFQMSTASIDGEFRSSYGGIDIQKIIDANLVFLHNPEEDLRVGPWWGV